MPVSFPKAVRNIAGMSAVFSLRIIAHEQPSASRAPPRLFLRIRLRAPVGHPARIRAEQPFSPSGDQNKRPPAAKACRLIPFFPGLRRIHRTVPPTKRLDRIDGQIQDRADTLIPFAHGSQPPDLLLLFLRHGFLPLLPVCIFIHTSPLLVKTCLNPQQPQRAETKGLLLFFRGVGNTRRRPSRPCH